jgi:hypothetical protein
MKIVRNISVASSLIVTCIIPAMAAVTIHTPSNGAEVESPVAVSATAITCASETVGVMGYSIDSSPDSEFVEGATLDQSVAVPPGTHTLHIKAWGDRGAVCVTDVTVTVNPGKPSDGPSGSVPKNAVTVSHLQSMNNWYASSDKGTVGHASGSSRVVSSPAIDGHSRQFVTRFVGSGGERYSLDFGEDRKVEHFFYDAWVYLNSSVTSVANLEMDMNQVMTNGWTVIYGVQCDGYKGTWDYTVNTGTPAHWHDHWLPSKAKCDLQSWKKNAWHHVQMSYSRNEEGKVTYGSVWLDGKENKIDVTVPSAFSLGWEPRLVTNFQLDGRGKSGSDTVYLGNLTISRW